MRDRSVLLRWAALAFLASLLLVPLIARSTRGGASTAPQSPTTFTDGQPALFYDQAAFLKAIRDADTVPAPEGAVIGGIVPHHLLPGYLINGFFRGLAATSHPKTIVLIGPNHRNEGRARVLTSELPWQTPFGTIEPDRELIDALTASGLASVDNSVLPSEHSVAGIMPAIKYYLPDARVVPLILNGATSLEETRRLGDALAANWNEDIVFVAPEDFSHYLIASEAERYDAVTLQALRDRDSAILFTLNNQYLDSPPSIATLMAAVDALGAKDFVLQAHTNSGALLHDDLAPTTSYFVGYYRMASSRTEPAAR